jgi:hypothetical protein
MWAEVAYQYLVPSSADYLERRTGRPDHWRSARARPRDGLHPFSEAGINHT